MTDKKAPRRPFKESKITMSNQSLAKLGRLFSDWTIDKRIERGTVQIRPRAEGAFPAILVVHDSYGINAHINDLCCRLAQAGFVASVPDLYGGHKEDLESGQRFTDFYTPGEVIDLIEKALFDLKGKPFVRPDRIGIMGLGAGGVYALLAASHLSGLKASVGFSSRFPRDANTAAKIRCPAIFFTLAAGDETDQVVTVRGNASFKLYLVALRAEIIRSFLGGARPPVFDPRSAAEAWNCVIQFFKRNVQGESTQEKKEGAGKASKPKRAFGIFGGRLIDPSE